MRTLIAIVLFFNLSTCYPSWEIDNIFKVNNENVKAVKFNNSYFLIEKKLKTIELSEINKYKNKLIDSNFNGTLLDIDIDSSHIVYNTYTSINYYNYNKENSLLKLKLELSEYIELKNNKTYSYTCYLAAKECKSKQRTYVQELNSFKDSSKKNIFPEPKGIDLTGFVPIKEITLLDSIIAISDIIDYNIKLYNRDKNILDSIVLNPIGWKQYSGTLPIYDCGPYINNFFQECYNIIDNYSRLKLLNTLNDSTLFVTWCTGYTLDDDTRFEYNHDIWVNKSNKWSLEETIDQTEKSKNKILDFDAMDLGNAYYIKHGYLYIIKPFPTDLVKKYYGKSKSDFESEMNEFYIDNDLQYTCFIYKYVP